MLPIYDYGIFDDKGHYYGAKELCENAVIAAQELSIAAGKSLGVYRMHLDTGKRELRIMVYRNHLLPIFLSKPH